MIINDIIKVINKSTSIAITCHTSADGDSVGSVLALTIGLRSINKKVSILSKEHIPKNLSFLPCSCEMNMAHGDIDSDTDCVIVLDCGNVERINANLDIENRKYTLINIDHHISNDMYADLNYTDPNSAAVGEIIYQMLNLMGISVMKEIAECLYVSIITDTGSFRFSNTTSITHGIAGDLINSGIDFSEIHRNVFENKDYRILKLSSKVISNMNLLYNNRLCILELNQDMFSEFGLTEDADTGGIISIGMQVNTVEVAVFFKETNEGIKVSLRSKSKVDVRKIAENFGGGGHVRAAGLIIKDNIKKIKEDLIEFIKKELV